MKNIILLVIILVSISSYAQENQNDGSIKKSELKLNAFNAIIFKSIDFSYEYLLDSESSVGVSLLFNLGDSNSQNFDDSPNYNEKFAFTPFFRHYFSRKYAQGFYIEAFGMYNVQEDSYSIFDDDIFETVFVDGTSSNFALGMSVGGKFVSRKGFAFEWYGGLGRNLATSNDDIATEIVPRFGASFGYRF